LGGRDVFESPSWSELVERLGNLWGVPGQGFQSGGTWGPEHQDPGSSPVRLVVTYPNNIQENDSQVTVETSVRPRHSYNLFQEFLLNAYTDEMTFPVVIDRWQAIVATDLGPASFTFIGDQRFWAGETTFHGQDIRVTAQDCAWQDLALIRLQASDVLPLSEYAARFLAQNAVGPTDSNADDSTE